MLFLLRNSYINHTKDSGDPSVAQVFIQALKGTWLYDKEDNGNHVGGKIERVRLFAVIAALIIIIACINFTNLSTARCKKHREEMCIRKVAGAQRSSLILQFITESIFLAFIAGTIAIIIVQFVLPPNK